MGLPDSCTLAGFLQQDQGECGGCKDVSGQQQFCKNADEQRLPICGAGKFMFSHESAARTGDGAPGASLASEDATSNPRRLRGILAGLMPGARDTATPATPVQNDIETGLSQDALSSTSVTGGHQNEQARVFGLTKLASNKAANYEHVRTPGTANHKPSWCLLTADSSNLQRFCLVGACLLVHGAYTGLCKGNSSSLRLAKRAPPRHFTYFSCAQVAARVRQRIDELRDTTEPEGEEAADEGPAPPPPIVRWAGLRRMLGMEDEQQRAARLRREVEQVNARSSTPYNPPLVLTHLPDTLQPAVRAPHQMLPF